MNTTETATATDVAKKSGTAVEPHVPPTSKPRKRFIGATPSAADPAQPPTPTSAKTDKNPLAAPITAPSSVTSSQSEAAAVALVPQVIKIDTLVLEEPYRSLLPIDDETYAAIRDDMKANGCDPSHPAHVWRTAGHYVLVDGFTRIKAATELGIASIVAGAAVLVCDNLSFSGEVKFARKHTRFINRDLPQLVERSIGQLMTKWHHQDKRIEAYKEIVIEDKEAHDLIIRSVDVGVCANSYIPSILHEWREPRHKQFEPRDVWSLFNAFTETLKQGNLTELPKRTEALHGLLDVAVGLN